jgi:hypothetical protein
MGQHLLQACMTLFMVDPFFVFHSLRCFSISFTLRVETSKKYECIVAAFLNFSVSSKIEILKEKFILLGIKVIFVKFTFEEIQLRKKRFDEIMKRSIS